MATAFLAGAFLAAAFLAGAFLATAFFAGAFLAAAFLTTFFAMLDSPPSNLTLKGGQGILEVVHRNIVLCFAFI